MNPENNANTYTVVWPRGRKTVEVTSLAERLESLEGKTIALVWDYLFRGDEIFPVLEAELGKRFPGIKFVNYDVFGSTHGHNEREVIAQLPEKLNEHGADAVISGMAC